MQKAAAFYLFKGQNSPSHLLVNRLESSAEREVIPLALPGEMGVAG